MALTCLRISRLGSHVKNSIQWNFCNSTLSVMGQKQFSAGAGEKVEPTSDFSESEKKLATEVEMLTKDLAHLKEKCIDLDDKYKRALAESENMRRRLTKQIEDAKLFGIQGFCKDLVSVADILEKATESVPANQINSNSHLKGLYEGLKLTEAELHKVFKRHGLAQVNPIDEKFDPNQHEALFEQPIPGKTAGSVIAVTKIGYKLHERIIRPALVGVAK